MLLAWLLLGGWRWAGCGSKSSRHGQQKPGYTHGSMQGSMSSRPAHKHAAATTTVVDVIKALL
jgi:hypothetical protein